MLDIWGNTILWPTCTRFRWGMFVSCRGRWSRRSCQSIPPFHPLQRGREWNIKAIIRLRISISDEREYKVIVSIYQRIYSFRIQIFYTSNSTKGMNNFLFFAQIIISKFCMCFLVVSHLVLHLVVQFSFRQNRTLLWICNSLTLHSVPPLPFNKDFSFKFDELNENCIAELSLMFI